MGMMRNGNKSVGPYPLIEHRCVYYLETIITDSKTQLGWQISPFSTSRHYLSRET